MSVTVGVRGRAVRLGRRAGLLPLRRLPRRIAVLPIRGYQLLLSPMIGQRCKYYPSCSQYALQAVQRFGILRGLVLAGWRLLRCNPWSRGGFDPVEAQRLFKVHGPAPSS